MKFATVVAPLALATTALANWGPWDPTCLNQSDVDNILAKEILFLQHPDIDAARAAAYSIFTTDIVEYGDSINSLKNDTLGNIVENGRTTYVNDTLSEPGTPKIVTNDVVYDCHNIVWRWSFYGIGLSATPPNARVNGFTLLKANADKLIYYQYVEFNSLAWAENFGFTVIAPTYGPFAPKPPAKVRREFKA